MIGKLTTALALSATASALVFGSGVAAADTGTPGVALTGQATCTHKDNRIQIEIAAPIVYAQAGYQPDEKQQVRYRTVIYDAAQLTLSSAGEWEQGKATDTKPADLDDTKVEVLRNDPNAYKVVQEVEWLAPDGENVVASTDLAATGYLIKDGRTELGTFAYCQ
ncbi:hypothetical protein IU433_29025 [Nocardia puris]|uniref:hypothetical protein n=1 Tax=Nocardia puris TaxID=208602 RepID=UPI001892E489|nr:hypothetical protein [Nocardia puris]MBF6213924.1 hypothetical protein [Nocardia puris]MBF6368563.1 hypothetical protein [Nocardia puris]MBF6463050.1 hypothetical protein [Nocardia puris]